MSSVFGKRPKRPAPPAMPSPKPGDVRTTEVRKDIYVELAKRRRATMLSQLSQEPAVLRRQLGGGTTA